MNIFQKAIAAGFSCLPCNGKIPAIGTWKKYMSELPDWQEAGGWSGNIGIVCGEISGGVTCIDFDVKNGDRWDAWKLAVNKVTPKTLSKLFVETTPSGGYHVVFRSAIQFKNDKLAMNKENAAMIETRGEGGYFVCAPSEGYKVYYNKLSKIEPLTDNEAQSLISTARLFNEFEKPIYTQVEHPVNNNGTSPFDKYDAENGVYDVLIKHGWKLVFRRGQTEYYRRPDKTDGLSATYNAIPGRFYCFTTSSKFENEKVYKPSAVLTILDYAGDYSAAARSLKNGR